MSEPTDRRNDGESQPLGGNRLVGKTGEESVGDPTLEEGKRSKGGLGLPDFHGHPLAERAEGFTNAHDRKPRLLQRRHGPVEDPLLAPPHKKARARAMDQGHGALAGVVGLAYPLRGPRKIKGAKGGREREAKPAPSLGRHFGQRLTGEHGRVGRIEDLDQRPLERREVRAPGKGGAARRCVGIGCKEHREMFAGEAEREARGRMDHEVVGDEIVKSVCSHRRAQRRVVLLQGIEDSMKIGVGVDVQPRLGVQALVPPQERRERAPLGIS